MIIMGADASDTGREPTTRVGADGGDDHDVVEGAATCSTVSAAPTSRRPSSSAMVGSGTARSSLNLDPFLGGSPGGAEEVGGGAVRGVCWGGVPKTVSSAEMRASEFSAVPAFVTSPRRRASKNSRIRALAASSSQRTFIKAI